MDRETLYDGMTGIRDDFVLQAGKPRRPAWQRWGAAAAALLMAAGLGLGGARLHYMAQHGSGMGPPHRRRGIPSCTMPGR